MMNLARVEKAYAAIFLIALSTLAIEIILSRILSVITYYYMAFSVISIAMLGMTAGAVTVFIKEKWFEENKILQTLSLFSIIYSLSILVTTIAIVFIPVIFDNILLRVGSLLLVIFFCSLPFYFSGIIITASLTKLKLPVNKLYASDLAGASIGCLLVLGGIEIFDALSLLLFCGLFGLPAAYLFSRHYGNIKLLKLLMVLSFLIAGLSSVNFFAGNIIRPYIVKGRKENKDDFVFEKWNSYSRVVVDRPVTQEPQYWGPSPLAPSDKKIEQYSMSIDGDAGTVLRTYKKPGDLKHLEYDLTNFAYNLRPGGNTCIIGVGAGKDVQAAIHFGQKKITGIDINPVFINLLKGKFREIAGIADNPAVSLKTDDARSYLTHSNEKFDLIQMSLIDTWAATGAGAFSLSENNLYTVEAWKVFLNRLTYSGIFTVSRWYSPDNLGETGRLVSLATETLLQLGKQKPSEHIALLTINNLSTLIVSSNPFSAADIFTIIQKAGALRYNAAIIPRQLPEDQKLAQIVSSVSSRQLKDRIANEELNYSPPTDENPYFFNMLRFGHLDFKNIKKDGGIMTGNLQATISLFIVLGCLFIFSILTSIVPLFLKTKNPGVTLPGSKQFIAGAFYFSLIGAGFILTEIALMQRLSVFLGHPVYAIGILLFCIILSTGMGSYWNGRFNIHNKLNLFLLPCATAILILFTSFLVRVVTSHFITETILIKIILSILVIFPVGLVLGQFFPTGMRLIRDNNEKISAWFWAMNGVFSVVFSVIAILISVYAGISYNFYAAAVCYLLLLFFIRSLGK